MEMCTNEGASVVVVVVGCGGGIKTSVVRMRVARSTADMWLAH